MKLEGTPFENSPVCSGIGFVQKGAGADIAMIKLTGRYPERGWMVNEIIYELAYAAEGSGQFITKNDGPIAIQKGDAIAITAGQMYAWDGHFTLVTACTPPFDPNQHKQVEETV